MTTNTSTNIPPPRTGGGDEPDAELLARIDAEVSRSLDTRPLCLELAASTGRDRADMHREVTAQALALYLEAHTSRRLAEGDE